MSPRNTTMLRLLLLPVLSLSTAASCAYAAKAAPTTSTAAEFAKGLFEGLDDNGTLVQRTDTPPSLLKAENEIPEACPWHRPHPPEETPEYLRTLCCTYTMNARCWPLRTLAERGRAEEAGSAPSRFTTRSRDFGEIPVAILAEQYFPANGRIAPQCEPEKSLLDPLGGGSSQAPPPRPGAFPSLDEHFILG